MTNEEIIREMREVREMNEREDLRKRAMTIEERVNAMCKWNNPGLRELVINEMKAAVKAEREACAQIIQDEIDIWRSLRNPSVADDDYPLQQLIEVLDKIRARSEKGE